MGYTLAAAIGSLELLTADRSGLPIVPLDDGWGLVPFPGADPDPDPDLPPGPDPEATLRALSLAGPVAWVWAEIVGGHGIQRATVWRDGAVVVGPLEGWLGKGRTPISQALAALGVPIRGGDEFATLRLDRHRHTGDWLADANP
jgi:hypothetical protein